MSDVVDKVVHEWAVDSVGGGHATLEQLNALDLDHLGWNTTTRKPDNLPRGVLVDKWATNYRERWEDTLEYVWPRPNP